MSLEIKHIKKNREKLNFMFRKMYLLFGRNSELSTYNKFVL